jgi:hypothetical protein
MPAAAAKPSERCTPSRTAHCLGYRRIGGAEAFKTPRGKLDPE